MKKESETYKILMVIAGGFIFAAGVNLFIVPLNLYSGGVIGIAQILSLIHIYPFYKTLFDSESALFNHRDTLFISGWQSSLYV